MGRFLGTIGQNPNVSKFNQLHVVIIRRSIARISCRMMGDVIGVLNFNCLIFKLKQFFCNYMFSLVSVGYRFELLIAITFYRDDPS